MKKISLFLLVYALFFVSCKNNMHFIVEGNINAGQDRVIYLEHVLLDKINKIDSFKIKKNGKFCFEKEHHPYPNFYRVRIDDKHIVFAIDSSETVTIRSEDPYFTNYSIEGSENIRKIHELNQSIENLEEKIKAHEVNVNNMVEINQLIAKHDSLAESIIYSDTKSSAAYYAIFHKINGAQFFNISNSNDMKHFAAVATAYNVFYPHSIRSKELTSLVQQAKQLKRSEELKQFLLKSNQVPTVMNINLPDVNGNNIPFSSLKGKVVLVNFAYFGTDHAMEYMHGLPDIYTKFHDKGFEIYGVSFEGDFDFFKNTSKTIPWIRVFDENGLNSDLLQTYDVSQLPTLFLVDREGNIVSRHIYIDNTLKETLEKLLKE